MELAVKLPSVVQKVVAIVIICHLCFQHCLVHALELAFTIIATVKVATDYHRCYGLVVVN